MAIRNHRELAFKSPALPAIDKIGAILALSLLAACGPGVANTDGPTPPGSGGSAAGSGAGGAGGSGGAAAGAATGGAGGGTGAGGSAGGATSPVIESKAVHRLSNVEYDNTLRDLTATALRFGDGFTREEADGFDNIATALSMSPRQVEDYFVAGRKVAADIFAQSTLRARIVKCTPDTDTACAPAVIRDFGMRAFRRPLSSAENTTLLAKYNEARTLGVDAMGALEHVVHIMLASPQFLYRIEYDANLADPTPHALDNYELANRLSYALWSSMPDDALFAAAGSAAGLSEPSAMVAQVDRMLADPKSEMLVKNFAAQWFGGRRLPEHVASATLYPAYGPELSASMQHEMELFFAEFLNGDRPFSEFLTADINFVDAPLAALYGMKAPSGTGLKKVVDTTDARSGFLGLAGFLTHTSRETRSSPIIRGKWILDAVWCMPLQVPANLVIPALPEPAEGAAPTTVREQIAAHRASSACSSCHNLMDPIGLALENFDGIGRYRKAYETGLAIDTSGKMPDGTMVNGLSSLASALAADPQFMHCAATKFGTYALGASSDDQNSEQIVARWTSGTPTLRNLIKEVIAHDSFKFRRPESQ